MEYKSAVLDTEITVRKDALYQFYPDGIIPSSKVRELLSTILGSINDGVVELENRLMETSDLYLMAMPYTVNMRIKEFGEVAENLDKGITNMSISDFDVLVQNTAEHLMKFADFLYGPPQFEEDWFKDFFNKYKEDIPGFSIIESLNC